MRTSSTLALVCSLAACSPSERAERGNGTPTAAGTDAERFACARSSAPLAPVCSIDRDADGSLTLRFPDGGFRRLRVVGDGRGVVAADGAELALVAVVGQGRATAIDVRLGGDRFRLPAHLAAATPR